MDILGFLLFPRAVKLDVLLINLYLFTWYSVFIDLKIIGKNCFKRFNGFLKNIVKVLFLFWNEYISFLFTNALHFCSPPLKILKMQQADILPSCQTLYIYQGTHLVPLFVGTTNETKRVYMLELTVAIICLLNKDLSPTNTEVVRLHNTGMRIFYYTQKHNNGTLQL